MNTISTSTPRNTKQQKRELSSPIDSTELNKNKVCDPVDISDMSDIAATTSSEVFNKIVLGDQDIDKIAFILQTTFEVKLKDMVSNIISGVVDALKDEVVALRSENVALKTRVASLESAADISRRNCLRISGIDESPGEDTDALVLNMAKAINANIELCDIDRSHRVGKPGGSKSRAIIVKFGSYRARQKLYRARTLAKDRGYMGKYIEDLTKFRNGLLYKTRHLVKGKHLIGAWSSDGNILVKDNSNSVHRIKQEDDLAPFSPVEPK